MTADTALLAIIVGYKICVLLVGFCMAFMGYRLFMTDKLAGAGDLSGSIGKYALSLKGGAPGVFFSLFGTLIIAITVFRGVSYDDLKPAHRDAPVQQIIPDIPK